jgi:hypothetical protein
VNEGEIVVASNEELHAARLNGKRLLALWNALPDVEKRKKVGDRDALVNELWSAGAGGDGARRYHCILSTQEDTRASGC